MKGVTGGIQKNHGVSLETGWFGVGYTAASGWVGAVKSSLRRWLRRTPLPLPELGGRVLELDGLWTRTGRGRVELKVVRDERGVGVFRQLGGSDRPSLAAGRGDASPPGERRGSGHWGGHCPGLWQRGAPSTVPLSSVAGVSAELGLGRLVGGSATAAGGEPGRCHRLGAANYGVDGRSGSVLV